MVRGEVVKAGLGRIRSVGRYSPRLGAKLVGGWFRLG